MISTWEGRPRATGALGPSQNVRDRTMLAECIGHSSEKMKESVLPISLETAGLRLDPAIRVRLHGRSRIPELAISLTLATTVLFFGASFFASAAPEQSLRQGESRDAPMVEMRSVATPASSLPARKAVRIIPIGQAQAGTARD